MKYVEPILAVLLLGTAIPSIGNFGNLTDTFQASRAEARAINERNTELRLEEQERQANAAIANQRYEDGCVPVVDMESRTQYVALVQGKPVLDSTTGKALPVGAVVCDAHGNTAVLTDHDGNPETPAIIDRVTFTGNTELVKRTLQEFPSRKYTMPISD